MKIFLKLCVERHLYDVSIILNSASLLVNVYFLVGDVGLVWAWLMHLVFTLQTLSRVLGGHRHPARQMSKLSANVRPGSGSRWLPNFNGDFLGPSL